MKFKPLPLLIFIFSLGNLYAQTLNTWVSGSNSINQTGIYGTQGLGSTSNIPGSRQSSISWEENDTIWLFGGFGMDGSGNLGRLNDLWKYNKINGQWTWVSGSNSIDQSGSYGTQGVGSTSNIPGARFFSNSWVENDTLWLFGGIGKDGSGNNGLLNDLWKYNKVNGQWTWVSGSNSIVQTGTYGTQGIGSTANIPGARYGGNNWEENDTLWLFGGFGIDGSGNNGILNDLWKYNKVNGQWTWVSGSNTGNQIGNYGTQGIGSTSNIPGARYGSLSWEENDTLWLFGGSGWDGSGMSLGYLNDLWKYNKVNGQWTWVSGSNSINQSGTYGTQGVGSTSNIPGARESSISWVENDTLWLLGGYMSSGYINDLWKYNKVNGQWTWVSGSNTANQNGSYGTQGVGSTSNIPGGRYAGISWEANDTLWLFGGYGRDGSGSFGWLNDLWSLEISSCVPTQITAEPAHDTLCAGNNTIFGLLASGDVDSFQWQRDISGTWTNLVGETHDTLTLNAVTTGMNGYQYRCIVFGACGNDTSSTATLTVNANATITSESGDTTLCKTGDALFTVGASGTITGYQWQRDAGSGFSDLSGENNDTLLLTGLTPSSNGYLYRCIVLSTCTNDTSAVATLTIINPQIASVTGDSVCPNAAGYVTATSIGGDVVWYDSLTNGNVLAQGDTFFFNNYASSTVVYAGVTSGGSDTVSTPKLQGNGQNGFMFDVFPNKSMIINSFDVMSQSASLANISVYYKSGTHVGHESNSGSWTLAGTATSFNAVPGLNALNLNLGVSLNANQTYAFYIASTITLSYTNGSGLGNLLSSNEDLSVFIGKGVAGLFGTTFQPRSANINIHYEIPGCESDTNTAVNIHVYTPPVINSISSSLNPSINGYAPMQCANLTVSASGGNSSYTYNWSPSGNGNPFNVCPTVGTWYQVTVIDSLGCQDTMSFKQSVKNAAGPQGRVYVCHLNNPRRPQYYTLAVTTAQVPYYIGLGATFGPCGSQPTKIGESEIVDLEDIYKIYPNPFSTELNIEFFSLFEEDVNITLTDMSGRELKTLMNERVYEGNMNRISTDASDLPSGMYLIRYVSDTDIRVQKVILNR